VNLIIAAVIAAVVALAVGIAAGIALGKKKAAETSRKDKESAENESRRILAEAEEKGKQITQKAEVEAKEESFKKKEQFDKEIQEGRNELKQWEQRITRREENLDRKMDTIGKKERWLENTEKDIERKRKDLDAREADLGNALEKQNQELQKVSGLSKEDAKQLLLERLSKELDVECANLISKRTERAREEAEHNARDIVTKAIQRYAAEHTAESVVSSVELPGDEMKGRIIGREGRNIRAFEKATGVDVIVDDTPGVIVLSAYDSVRREIARLSMERLVTDGRVHPARIEEVVESARQEVMDIIHETGKRTCYEANVRNVPGALVELLGRLRYRTSYGQNVLEHSLDVCHLSGLMAAELKLDVAMAKRCGLLHDIGKAMDHEIEGSHAAVGADMARRCDEPREVVNAIAAHHEEEPAESVYAALVSGADAISAGRPGARRETLERYIKRLEKLESIAKEFPGVETAFAIQAGRELRVIVNSSRVDDSLAAKMCRDIAAKIQEELKYPGEIVITVIRETRVVEKAR